MMNKSYKLQINEKNHLKSTFIINSRSEQKVLIESINIRIIIKRMQTERISIDTDKTYTMDKKDLHYLDFYASKILQIKTPPKMDMTTCWNTKYQEKDFRHYLDQLFQKFYDKVRSQQNQIASLRQQQEYYSQYVKYKDYFEIFSRVQNEKRKFVPKNFTKRIFCSPEQKQQFLRDLDDKCRTLLWRIDSMKMPIATQVSNELSMLQTKDNKIQVYERILSQIHRPQKLEQTMKMLDNVSLVEKSIMENLVKVFQSQKTDTQIKIKYYELVIGHFMIATCSLQKYFIGKKDITDVQLEISKSTKSIENDYEKKVQISNQMIKVLIKSIQNHDLRKAQSLAESKRKKDKDQPNWKNLLNQSMSLFKKTVQTNFSRQSLINLKQKLQSFGQISSEHTKLCQRLNKHCQQQQSIDLYKLTISQICEKRFNLDTLSTSIDILEGLDCSGDQKLDLKNELQKQIVYGLLFNLAEQIQLNKKQSYLRIIMEKKEYAKIKKLKGVKILHDCFCLKQSQTNTIERSKQLVKSILLDQFQYQFDEKTFGLLTKGHIVYQNLLGSITKLKDKLAKRHKKLQIDGVEDVLKWIKQFMRELKSILKKNPYGNISIPNMLEVSEKRFGEFLKKVNQEYDIIKNRFRPTKEQCFTNIENKHQAIIDSYLSETTTAQIVQHDHFSNITELTQKNIQLEKQKSEIQTNMMNQMNKMKDELDEMAQNRQSVLEDNKIMRKKLNYMGVEVDKLLFKQRMRQTRQKSNQQTIAKDGIQVNIGGQIYQQQQETTQTQLQAFIWVLDRILTKMNEQYEEKNDKNKEIYAKKYQKLNTIQYSPQRSIKKQEQQVQTKSTIDQLLNQLFDKEQLQEIQQTTSYFSPKAQKVMWQSAFNLLKFQYTPNKPESHPSQESSQYQVVQGPQQQAANSKSSFDAIHNNFQTQLQRPQQQNLQPNHSKPNCQSCTHKASQLQEAKSSYENKISSLIQQLNDARVQKQNLNDQLTKQLSAKDQTIKDLTQQVFQLKTQNNQLTQSHQSAIKVKDQEISNAQAQINSTKDQFDRKIQQILQQNNLKITQKDQKIQELTHKITQIQNQPQDKLEVPQNLSNNYSQRQTRLRQVERQRDELRRNQRKAKEQIKQNESKHLKKIKELQLTYARQLKQRNEQINSLRFQIDTMNRKFMNNNSSEGKPGALGNELREKLQMHKIKTQLQQEKNTNQSLIDRIQAQAQKHKLTTQKIQDSLAEKQLTINQLKKEIMTLKHYGSQSTAQTALTSQTKKQTTSPESALIVFDRYFMGQVLQDQYDKKYQLYNLIQQKTKSSIKKTRLLYRFDKLNPASFHNYIDGINNIAIIVQTRRNIFGAFSTSKLQPKYREPQFTTAFMFSYYIEGQINSFSYSEKKQTAKSLTYDEYFLIVGNSEIRLKLGQSTVYSNFGINNGFYDTKGLNVEAILKMDNQRQDDLVTYECFEVVFDDDQF